MAAGTTAVERHSLTGYLEVCGPWASLSKYDQLTRHIIELCNAVYKYFIDLDPSLDENIQFLQVSRQIRSEFGSLYLSQGNATVPFDRLITFLRHTFQPIASQRPRDFTCSFRVELNWNEMCWHQSSWTLDMLAVVSFMRQYPLLNFGWDLNRSARSYWPIRIGRSDRSDVSDEDDETEDEESDQEEPEDARSEQVRSEEVQPEEADSEEEE